MVCDKLSAALPHTQLFVYAVFVEFDLVQFLQSLWYNVFVLLPDTAVQLYCSKNWSPEEVSLPYGQQTKSIYILDPSILQHNDLSLPVNDSQFASDEEV